MAIRTQGTNVYVFDGTTLTTLECITDIDLGSDSTSKLDNTCLEETNSKAYLTGLNDPGEGSITINFDDENESHIKLHELAEDKADLQWFIGASGSTAAPTVAGGVVSLPTTRTFWRFRGSLAPATPTFGQDALVTNVFTLTRSTGVTVVPKA